jgi:hypothetical protein
MMLSIGYRPQKCTSCCDPPPATIRKSRYHKTHRASTPKSRINSVGRRFSNLLPLANGDDRPSLAAASISAPLIGGTCVSDAQFGNSCANRIAPQTYKGWRFLEGNVATPPGFEPGVEVLQISPGSLSC